MMEFDLTLLFASIVAGATPIVLAALGETITEKAGIINLSLDGTILLSAMTAFAVAYETGGLGPGLLAGAAIGAFIAGVVAVFSIYLGQNQVAVGFVLTLTTRDLA
jgi:simple sugar transport system permease protein